MKEAAEIRNEFISSMRDEFLRAFEVDARYALIKYMPIVGQVMSVPLAMAGIVVLGWASEGGLLQFNSEKEGDDDDEEVLTEGDEDEEDKEDEEDEEEEEDGDGDDDGGGEPAPDPEKREQAA